MTMTTKTIKTILLAGIIFSVAIGLGSSFNNAWATNENYLEKATIVFEETKKLDKEIFDDNLKIEELKTKNSSEKTDSLAYLMTESEIKKQQKMLDAKIERVSNLHKEIKDYETLNIAAYAVDSVTKQKFIDAENALYNTYFNVNSDKYFGENPVEDFFGNTKDLTMVVFLDPKEITEKNINVKEFENSISQTIENAIGEKIPLEVEFATFVDTSGCSDRDVTCHSIGGLTVAKQYVNTLNTMGYQASKSGYGTGFVIAGHTAENFNSNIVQPDHNNSGVVGTTKAYQYNIDCDCAYVQITNGVTGHNEIYKSSNQVYTVTGKTVDSSQTVNSWAYKSGAATGVVLGQIVGNVAGNSWNSLYIYNGGGDSGSPIFTITSGDNVSLYGMAYRANTNSTTMAYVKYHPWEQIQNQIGATPP